MPQVPLGQLEAQDHKDPPEPLDLVPLEQVPLVLRVQQDHKDPRVPLDLVPLVRRVPQVPLVTLVTLVSKGYNEKQVLLVIKEIQDLLVLTV